MTGTLPGGGAAWGAEPLFSAELLRGAAAMPTGHRTRIEGFLHDVTAARPAPLHPATAWNALRFGFDPSAGCYREMPADLLDVQAGPADGIPVGAFVRHDRGTHTLWGEVVAVFGDADALAHADGWVDPEAPCPSREACGVTGDPEALLPERVIVDWNAIYPMGGGEARELGRYRPAVVDRLGHVCRTAAYRIPKPGLAGLALDLALYADHLVRHREDYFADMADVPDDDLVLHAAVSASLGTVAEILAATPGLMTWAGYATPKGRFGSRMASPGPFGGNELRDLAHRVTRTKPHETRATAIFPALNHLDATRRGNVRGDETAWSGIEVAEAIVHAHLAIAQQADNPPAGVRVTVRDTWQAGGIWVSTPVETEVALDAEFDDEDFGDEEFDDEFDVTQYPDSLLVGSCVLTSRLLDSGVLPLSEALSKALGERKFVLVDMRDESGPPLLPSEALQHAEVDGNALRIAWPLSVQPGDRAVAGLTPGAARIRIDLERRPASNAGGDGAFDDNVRGAVLAKIRLAGAHGDRGERTMPANVLLDALIDDYPNVENTRIRRSVVAACRSLAENALLHVSVGELSTDITNTLVQHRGVDTYTWWPPGVEPSGTTGSPPPADGALPKAKAAHEVAPHLRRLRPGAQASDVAREEYASYAVEHGLDPNLPAGRTHVRPHARGGRADHLSAKPARPDDRSL
ncbi:hypothetical protein [Yinghuangia sp. YIM S09857]|uniref:hypothetical protein n=1 Tax=Yinghuangia sp. YIM S09857 TaxID=3436929 RepID=UPI003F530417